MEAVDHFLFLLLFVPEFSLLGFLVLGFSLTAPPSPPPFLSLSPSSRQGEVRNVFCFLVSSSGFDQMYPPSFPPECPTNMFLFSELSNLKGSRRQNHFFRLSHLFRCLFCFDPICRTSHLFHGSISTLSPPCLLCTHWVSCSVCVQKGWTWRSEYSQNQSGI